MPSRSSTPTTSAVWRTTTDATGAVTATARYDELHDRAAGLPLGIGDGARRYVWGLASLAYAVETVTCVIEIVHSART